ncbi:MAG: T9SS type A sorting domain-containing protein [Crocinitomicaceae bacterium]
MNSIKIIVIATVFMSSNLLFSQTQGDIQHFTSDTHTHDSTNCSTNIIVDHTAIISNSFLGDSIIVKDGGGGVIYEEENTSGSASWMVNIPYPDFWMEGDINISGGALNMLVPSNIYKIISGPDTLYAASHFFSQPIPDACAYNTVEGQVYIDNDNDCSYNTGDSAIFNLNVSPSGNWSNTPFDGYNGGYTNGSGNYTATIQESWLVDYSVSVPSYYQFIFPNSTCTPLSYTFSSLPQTGVDFVLECADVDTYVSGTPGGNVHAALPFQFYASASNIGCDQVSGTLKLVLDTDVTYNAVNSSNPADYTNGDTLFWDYTNLNNIAGGAYWNSIVGGIELMPNPSVNTGDTLCFEIMTGVPGNDIDPTNNSKSICFPVVAAYDPNIKNVTPAGTGQEGFIPANTVELEYTIHFQNTGTADAINIKITDTLENHIIPSSLRIIDASHAMTPEWVSSNVIDFNFNNIYLPDSNANEPESHGFVKFKIDMEQGLAEGTEIKNKVYIYFDNNPAVITDYALNTIEYTSSIEYNEFSDVTLYPNPTTGVCYVQGVEDLQKIEVISISGKVLTQTTNKKIDLSDYPKGIYLIQLYTSDKVLTKKLIKH